MISHGHPPLNTYVIEHHPRILKILTQLHSLDKIKSKHNSIDGHLEQINLMPNLLIKKIIILNIIVTRKSLQFEDTIKGAWVIEMMFQ